MLWVGYMRCCGEILKPLCMIVCARQMAQSLGTNQTLLACASLAKVVVSLIV